MNSPTEEELVLLHTALRGFHEAKLRYEERSESQDELEVFIPLAEALWWARSVDEGFEKIDGSAYKGGRDADPQGRVMQGLRLARNRSGHQRALTIVRQEGLTYPLTYPMRYFDIVWRPLAEIPSGDRADLRGESHYTRYLESRSAGGTLDSAAGWFAHASNRPESKARPDVPWPPSTDQ